MKSARERYQEDTMYNALVNQIKEMLRQGKFSPSEVREATILASIIHEEERVKLTISLPYTKELEDALNFIHKSVEESK